ncbi:glycosyltransferase family 39 protein [Elusimicrobiota bacterium]
MNDLPLSGDAPGFVKKAQNMTSFYEASNREPFWIAFTKINIKLFEQPKTGMRISAVILLICSSILIFIISFLLIGFRAAYSSCLFFLYIPYLSYSPLRAHRLELYLFLMLLITTAVLYIKKTMGRTVILTILFAALFLTRMESIVFIAAAFILYLNKARRSKRIQYLILSTTVFLTLSASFNINCLIKKGSLFSVLNKHSRFYATHEMASRGSISNEKALSNKAFASVHTVEYLFYPENLLKNIFRVFNGYYVTLTSAAKHLLSVPVNLAFFLPVIWIALFLMLLKSGGRWLLLWGLLYLLPHSFMLADKIAGRGSVDIRFAAAVTPLLSFSFGFFVDFLHGIPKIKPRFCIRNKEPKTES